MVKISAFAFIAVLAATAAANCKDGFYYCGWGLKGQGDYSDSIDKALQDAGIDPTRDTRKHSIFKCEGGNGRIVFDHKCGGCINAGPGKNDWCKF